MIGTAYCTLRNLIRNRLVQIQVRLPTVLYLDPSRLNWPAVFMTIRHYADPHTLITIGF